MSEHGLCTLAQEETVNILSRAFRDDAFHRYVLLTWNSFDARSPIDTALNQEFFAGMLCQLEEDGALSISLPGTPFAIVW